MTVRVAMSHAGLRPVHHWGAQPHGGYAGTYSDLFRAELSSRGAVTVSPPGGDPPTPAPQSGELVALVSIATLEQPRCRFTPFPGCRRMHKLLEGRTTLYRDGILLSPHLRHGGYDFSGDEEIECRLESEHALAFNIITSSQVEYRYGELPIAAGMSGRITLPEPPPAGGTRPERVDVFCLAGAGAAVEFILGGEVEGAAACGVLRPYDAVVISYPGSTVPPPCTFRAPAFRGSFHIARLSF